MVRVNKVHVHATGKRGEVETVAATYVEVEQLACLKLQSMFGVTLFPSLVVLDKGDTHVPGPTVSGECSVV